MDDFLKSLTQTSERDQMDRALRENATFMYRYFAALTDAGFDPKQAMMLVNTFLMHVLGQAKPNAS
jgi:hypothetical protein